ncbi:NUDIX hydrolase [Halosimplex salinum]|uniref:NUDIX hydrolase n=1 Tax=Halosimplex salinum TaxID=1710538 RepID=UPI003741F8EE
MAYADSPTRPATVQMTAVDNLWYLASEARQQAEQVYHGLADDHEDFVEYETLRSVSRDRFRTVAERIEAQGLPYGAHTLAYNGSGEVLLVEQASIDTWVLPGGEVEPDETIREGARRELGEEAGIDVDYDGLGVLGEVRFRGDGHETWGVLPIFEGRATSTDLVVRDPDDEITDARWFAEFPENTRDRDVLSEWREKRFGD